MRHQHSYAKSRAVRGLVTVLAMVAAVSASAQQNCTAEYEALQVDYKERRTEISEDLTEAVNAVGEWWQSNVVPVLNEMGAQVGADLKAAETEAERAPIRAAYHKERRAFLTESQGTYHEARGIAQRIATERVRDLQDWWNRSVRALRKSEDCQATLDDAQAEDLDAERRMAAFGEEAPMDQAVQEFHNRQEERRALEDEIADTEARLKGRQETLQRYDEKLSDSFARAEELMGDTGLDGVAPEVAARFRDRVKDMLFPDTSEFEPVDMNDITLEALERQIDPFGELSDFEMRAKMRDAVEGGLREAASDLRNAAFRDAIEVMMEQSTLPEKIDLLNQIERMQQHQQGLRDLIDNDQQQLEDLRKTLGEVGTELNF